MIRVEGIITGGRLEGTRAEFVAWVAQPHGGGPLQHPEVKVRLLEKGQLHHWAGPEPPAAGTEIILDREWFRPTEAHYSGDIYIAPLDRGTVLAKGFFPDMSLDDLVRLLALGSPWDSGDAGVKITIKSIPKDEEQNAN